MAKSPLTSMQMAQHIWNNSDYWVYWDNRLRFLDGSFASYSKEHFKSWAWPRVIRKNRWILKRYVSFLEESTSKRSQYADTQLDVYWMYCILPNKGAGRSSKVKSDTCSVETKLTFQAFKWWFRIENRTIIKEIVLILVSYDSTGFLQTTGGTLIRGGALDWQIMVYTNKASYLCMKTVPIPSERAIAQACWPPAPPKHARTCRDVSYPFACVQ